jgi:hypothetical protein
MNGYISVKDAAKQWGVTARQVQRMCITGKIAGLIRFTNAWAIPADTEKPTRTGKFKPGPKPKDKSKQGESCGVESE